MENSTIILLVIIGIMAIPYIQLAYDYWIFDEPIERWVIKRIKQLKQVL